jgi:hypothetical protein
LLRIVPLLLVQLNPLVKLAQKGKRLLLVQVPDRFVRLLLRKATWPLVRLFLGQMLQVWLIRRGKRLLVQVV